MKYSVIENEKIINFIVCTPENAESFNAIYAGDLPVDIGDGFIDNRYVVTNSEGVKTYYDIPDFPQPEDPPEPETPVSIEEALSAFMEGFLNDKS